MEVSSVEILNLSMTLRHKAEYEHLELIRVDVVMLFPVK